MKIRYIITIANPANHIVNVKMNFEKDKNDSYSLFLPSWSPGSYLMREYCRNIRTIHALDEKGRVLDLRQEAKGEYVLNLKNAEGKKIEVNYDIYCHELTVRTSHVDESHAFLHGPSYLMGIKGENLLWPEIEFRFPALWSKISTGLKAIEKESSTFLYTAVDYDELIDAPVEIGCHETDGFMYDGKEHHLAFYGDTYPHGNNLKNDIKKIIETVASHFSTVPYDSYHIITHFAKGLYGGLEHLNSTALQFDGRKLASRESYVNWLALVAHEYFHTWNVKRIRPVELGPFDYQSENYTRMHWLTEGLTSFMDELFVLRSGLCSEQEYLSMQKNNLAKYFSIPGRKFHSLEDSSFNAWIKLYRPDENSNNSSISYYLKGGLVFSILHFEFLKVGRTIDDLLVKLWDRYLANPKVGMLASEVFDMIEAVGNKNIRDKFEIYIMTTQELDFETYYNEIGCEFDWENKVNFELGVDYLFEGSRVFLEKVHLDGVAYKSGLNAGDEILSINEQRFLKDDIDIMNKTFLINSNYSFLVSRLGRNVKLNVMTHKPNRTLKEIRVINLEKFKDAFFRK